jgi:IS30 family transposase
MTQERLSLRKIREVLRLKHEVGLSNRAIARACRVSNSTVGEYLRRAKLVDLNWPLPEDLSEEALYQRLFGEKPTSSQSGARRPTGKRCIGNWHGAVSR